MPNNDMIWAQLIHLGFNMWADRDTRPGWNIEYTTAQPQVRCDEQLWDELMEHYAAVGINTVVIDLGEGVEYESHPELAVEGTWSKEKLAGKLARMRELGLTPIPKMNFSTAHDIWLGEYSRMISTSIYYKVVSDLIAEAIELFDNPPLFHLGMDEENWGNQKNYDICVIRQYDLWWHDVLFFVDQVEKAGSRAWVWSDYMWEFRDIYLERMPKSVMQSNWYYGYDFTSDLTGVEAYLALEEHGYDQIPTGSNWTEPANFEKTVNYCTDNIATERLKGFMQSIWKPTLERRRLRHIEGADEVGRMRQWFESR
jgi:hypothetical protein